MRIHRRMLSNFKPFLIIACLTSLLFVGVYSIFRFSAFGAGVNDVTATMTYLGKPFTKWDQYYNNTWDIQKYNGKLYLGHGDWAYNAGPIPVVSLDPATDTFVTNEYSVDDESIWRFKVLNGDLYIPGSDAHTGNWNWGQYYKLDAGGWRQSRTIPYALHVLDMEYFDGKLWAGVGAEGGNSERLGKYELQSSSDGGKTWQIEMPSNSIASSACYNRCYTLFHLDGKLYGSETPGKTGGYVLEISEGGSAVEKRMTFSGNSDLPNYNYYVMNRTENFNDNLLFTLEGYDTDVTTSGDGYHTPVAMMKATNISNATRVNMPDSNAIPTDILVRDDRVYVLANIKTSNTKWTNIVYYSSDLSTWTEAFRFDTGAMARSFEEVDRDFYIGTGGTYSAKNSNYGKIYKVPASLWAPQAEITSFTAPAGPVASAANITISAQVANVTSCSLSNGIGAVSISGTPADGTYATGTISRSVSAQPSYELTCVDALGGTVSKKVYTAVSDIQSNVADLSALSIAEGILYPAFNPDITEYTLNATAQIPGLAYNVSSLTLDYSKADSSATTVVTGNSTLSAGKNTISIKVTAQNSVTTKTYTISCIKLPAIASLTAQRNGGNNENFPISPTFDPGNYSAQYQAIATTTSSSYALNIGAADPGVTVSLINSEGGGVASTTGTTAAYGVWTNRLIVLETADGVRQEYKFRIRGLSNVATLSNLVVKNSDDTITYNLDPVFATTTESYTLSVPNEITSLNITATTTNAGASKIITGNSSLSEGENTVTIAVASEGGTVTKNYVITVTRAQGETPTKTTPALSDIEYSIPSGIIYDSTSKAITAPTPKSGVTGLGTITVKYVGTAGTTYSESATAPTNAGSYTVYADIAEGANYTAAKLNLGVYTINKKSISISSATIMPKTYDGTTSATISAVSFSGLVGGQTMTLSTDYSVSSAQFNSAGAGTNKTVTATVALVANSKTSNYSLTSGALSVGSQTIQKASASGVSQTFAVKSELADTYTFDLRSLLPSNIVSAVSDYVVDSTTGNIYTMTPSVSGYILTLPVASTSAGNAKSVLTISFVSANYNISTANVTVNVSSRTPVEISGVSVASRAYNGSPIVMTGSAVFKNTDTQATISGLSPIYAWKTSDDTTLSGAPTNAGSYKLVVTADGGSDYTVSALVISFEISKASQTISFTCPSNGTIGDEISLSATASSGLPDISFSSSDENVATILDNKLTFEGEGSVTITATQAGNANYNTANKTCTISVANAPVQGPSVLQGFADFDGSSNRTAIIDADITDFVKLMLGNDEVPTENYSVESGSTIITLSEAYLQSFAPGTYQFTAVFANGINVPLGITILAGSGTIGLPGTGALAFLASGNNLAIAGLVLTMVALSVVLIAKVVISRQKKLNSVRNFDNKK